MTEPRDMYREDMIRRLHHERTWLPLRINDLIDITVLICPICGCLVIPGVVKDMHITWHERNNI